MKTTSFLLAVAICFGSASGALASDKKHSKQPKHKHLTKVARPEAQKMALTGSYIKQDVSRIGIITDAVHPTYVLDQESIQLSGASNLSQVLIRTGFRR